MSDTRGKQIDEIFRQALERNGSERSRFVNNQCSGDEDLKREVLELLTASESPSDKLDTRMSEIRDRLLRSVFDDGTDAGEDLGGKTVHHWRIESRIARGGLATVYLARRDDGQFEQKAAFKVLRRGLDTDDLIARFRAERQILSNLEHPCIARILDGGALDDGRPYLVLEYVEGLPITEYCAANALSIKDRVVLMIAVLRALHHAHSHLIVHRDIKPSNILVSADGHVSLLDFGIAKLLDPGAMPGASSLTRTGISLLTPGYGSPEQHAGEPVTTASDIYQCGLVLYEMLVGERPFKIQPDEHSALVPSQRLRGKPGFRQVRGDLDAIVRKATRGDSEQRYASADEMVQDLRRYLDGLPVIAQPDSLAYRISKLARRRPWLTPVAVLAVLGIAAYIATITVYSQRVAREERLAQASQQFLVGLFRSPDPFAPVDASRGSNITVVEALEIGRQRIDSELSDQPELKASLLVAISEVYDSLDQVQKALMTRDEALALERGLYGLRSPQVIASLRALGGLFAKNGQPDKADQHIQQQLQLARETFDANSAQLGLAEISAGIHARGSGRMEKSGTLLRSGISKLRPQRARYARELIGALIASAENNGMERPEVAFATIAEAEKTAREAFGENSVQAASVQIRLASSMTMQGDYEGSERNFRKALPVLEERLGKDHGSTLSALNNLGYLYIREGNPEKAEPIYRELLSRQIRLYGPESRPVADSYQNLGGTLAKLGRYEEALPLHYKAYAIFQKVLKDDSYIVAFPLLSIAYSQLRTKHAVLAGEAATEALKQFEKTVPGTFLEGVARCLVGLSLEAQGRADEGSAMVLSSHELMKTGSIPDPYPTLCRLPGN